MSPKHTNSGIHVDDEVLTYLDSYENGRREVINLRYGRVERVTPTQVVIDGMRYYAAAYSDRRGEPVKPEDREYVYDEKAGRGGRLKFAHPNIVHANDWEHLIAKIERPECLARAKALSSAMYNTLGYPFILRLEQILELSKNPALMVSLDTEIQKVDRVRREALESGRAFFAHSLGIEVDR